jgi:hypothetical protein
MKKLYYIWYGIFLVGLFSFSHSQILEKYCLQNGGSFTTGPISNGITDIRVYGNEVWIAAGRGLSRTSDNGETWITYTRNDGLGKGGVSAFAKRNNIIWAATVYDTTIGNDELLAGGGLSFSNDDGETWEWIPQPVDSRDITEYKPTTTHVQNTTWDIALTDSAVWITSWGGGLRKSTDMGTTWEVVTVDGFPFDVLRNYTHMGFAVIYDENALWAGSGGGIHKSTDGGNTWITFNHQNQTESISGNWIVALGHQQMIENDLIWAATWSAEGEAADETEYRAVSWSEDGGLTWNVTLKGESAHNFAFDDSIVYAATDNGLFKSINFGETWAVFPQIEDSNSDEKLYSTEFYSTGVGKDNILWAGSADGLVRTSDNGISWKIFHTFQVPGENGTPKTYAYPNPFSPLRHNLVNDEGHVRFQYRTKQSALINVHVYDYGMNLVRSVAEDKERSSPGDYYEVWDGRNDIGDMVANGVYFYKISISGKEVLWGKVMVVN